MLLFKTHRYTEKTVNESSELINRSVSQFNDQLKTNKIYFSLLFQKNAEYDLDSIDGPTTGKIKLATNGYGGQNTENSFDLTSSTTSLSSNTQKVSLPTFSFLYTLSDIFFYKCLV